MIQKTKIINCKIYQNSKRITLLNTQRNLLLQTPGMLRSTITTTLLIWLCVMTSSDPLPDSYNFAFFFQVDIGSTIVYSPTQTSVIYSNNNTECFTFRQSLQQDESPQREICMNESIFGIEYNPQGDRVYVTTNIHDVNSSAYKVNVFEVVDGMIKNESRSVFGQSFDSQIIGYPIVDVSKDGKIAIFLLGALTVVKENTNFSHSSEIILQNLKLNYEVVELQWHPSEPDYLFIAGNGYNQILNIETQTSDFISNMTTVHMNIMYNGSIVLLQQEETESNSSRVYVFSYLNYRVTFIEAYTDFVLYNPGLCSKEGNIMGLVRDLMQLHIYNATYQDEQLIGGTFTFQRLQIIEFIPGISDGSMAVDGSQIYLRGYVPIKKLTRCPQGMLQAGYQCEACSADCDTCHRTSTSCTSCNQGYFVSNEKCLLCTSEFRGCTVCSPSRCLTCNDTANFNPFPSDKNECKCRYGTYLTNNGSDCTWCNTVFEGCSYCQNSQKCLKCEQNYELDEQDHTCKAKSKLWLILVAIGGAVLLIIGVCALVWYIKKKKRLQSGEGYSKFKDEDNSAITRKQESFIKSISSEKSSIEEDKPSDLIESNNQISQVEYKKSYQGFLDGKQDGRPQIEYKNDRQ